MNVDGPDLDDEQREWDERVGQMTDEQWLDAVGKLMAKVEAREAAMAEQAKEPPPEPPRSRLKEAADILFEDYPGGKPDAGTGEGTP